MLAWAEAERPLLAVSGVALALGAFALLAAGGGALWLTRTSLDDVHVEGGPPLAAEALAAPAPPPSAVESTRPAITPAPPSPAREPATASGAESGAQPALFIGSVRAPDGTPIEGATLSIYDDTSQPRTDPLGTGRSDAHGRFAFAAAPTSATYLMIGAEAPGFLGVTKAPVVAGLEVAIEIGRAHV